MDPASLALGVIAPVFGIGKAIRNFYKNYQDVHEELEKLAKKADTWEKIIDAAHMALQEAHRLSSAMNSPPKGLDTASEQYALCKRLLYQLSDELKMPPEAAKKIAGLVSRKRSTRDLDESMAELEQCCKPYYTIASIDSAEQYRKKFEGFQSYLNNVEKHQTRVDKRDILQWITNECQWEAHNEHAADFQPGTLEAILNSDEYYEWQNGLLNEDGDAVAPATLWCHGPPGAGKLTLVYAIIERLRQFYGKDAVIVYAYCSYEKQDTHSARSTIACLVRTALSQHETMPDFVVEAWERHDHGLSSLSLPSLRDLLCKLLVSQRKSFILVDALDEITSSQSKNERRLEPDDVLNEVVDIVERVNELNADQGQIRCRALFTSREKCPARFSRLEVAEMPIEATEPDVQITVGALIDKGFLRRLNTKIKKDTRVRTNIVDKTSKSAKGVFLLAKLQLEHLRQFTNLRDLTEALGNLPQDLEESHERSMQRIRNQPANQQEIALKALSLVYYAKGVLTVKSAQQALAVRDGDKNFMEEGTDDEETLINITAGLLAMRSGNLVFVHHTVQEFLRKPEGKVDINDCDTAGDEATQNWFTDKNLTHGYMANQCLNFLVLEDFAEPLDDKQRRHRAQQYPFLDYAVENVGFHAYRSNTLEEDRYALTHKCLALLDDGAMPLGSLQEFLGRMWTNPSPPRVRAVQIPKTHLAVLFNFVGIARNLVTTENVNHTATPKNETVLHFAARIKAKTMVEMLLEKGADQNLVNYSGKTPLDMILGAPLLKLSFSSGILRTMPGIESENPGIDKIRGMIALELMHYIESRTNKQLMLDDGEHLVPLTVFGDAIASRHATDEIATVIERKLKLTISEEGEQLAALLISVGVDINSHKSSLETPLQLATLYELPGLVKLLLENGANPFLAWHCTFTAAEIADKRGNSELTHMIRKKEKDIGMWELTLTDERAQQSKLLLHTCIQGLVWLTSFRDIPGRVQAAYFIRESRKLSSERSERMIRSLYSAIAKLSEEVAKTEGKSTGDDSSRPSKESMVSEMTEPKRQQSAGESAEAPKTPSPENKSSSLLRGPPEDSSKEITSGEIIGDDHSSNIGSKQDSSHVPADSIESTAQSLDTAAAATSTASSNAFSSEEDTFVEVEGRSTSTVDDGNPIPHDDSYHDWDDSDITLHLIEEILPSPL